MGVGNAEVEVVDMSEGDITLEVFNLAFVVRNAFLYIFHGDVLAFIYVVVFRAF
ncbi:hypothetical protein D3C84_1227630 [compost metagenome]